MPVVQNKIIVGWREWLSLPELGVYRIKAKIDTGARTSALHAFKVELLKPSQVCFHLHPRKRHLDHYAICIADIVDQRWVSDSGGHREFRYVISTALGVGSLLWHVEVTLTNRDDMRFPMLLGRTAMQGRLLVDPQSSYLLGKPQRVGSAR